MSVLTDVFLALAVILFTAYWYYLATKHKKFFKNFPGPRPLFFFGNALDITSTTDILDTFLNYKETFGGIVKLQFGPVRKGLLISDYKFLEHVLSSTKILNKSDDYLYLRPWLGTGLLTSDGPKWKGRRKILTPTFHFQILEQFIDIFEAGGNTLIQKLEKEVDKSSVDIYPFVTLCALDIICETAMGTKINAQNDNNSDYVQSVKNMCRIIIERSFHLLQMLNITYPLSKNYYTQKKALKILHRQTNDVISKRRKQLLENKVNTESKSHEDDGYMTKNKKAFLDLLIETRVDGKPLSQEDIREEVDTFMFEGHDTTASAISFALFCLANHPDVQKKALEEQQALFGDNKNPKTTYADLQSMKYLEQVIKETLRLYPSVPVYARKTDKPVEYNGIVIPEGIILSIFAYGIHRDPKYFKDPLTFNPSRFENIDGKLPYAFIPFSAGPRNCIGQKFAMLEMKSTVSKVIRKFELHPAIPKHTVILASEAVLKSANGINIALKLRK